jgi:hypothetical protein
MTIMTTPTTKKSVSSSRQTGADPLSQPRCASTGHSAGTPHRAPTHRKDESSGFSTPALAPCSCGGIAVDDPRPSRHRPVRLRC